MHWRSLLDYVCYASCILRSVLGWSLYEHRPYNRAAVEAGLYKYREELFHYWSNAYVYISQLYLPDARGIQKDAFMQLCNERFTLRVNFCAPRDDTKIVASIFRVMQINRSM
jgi:hypothetical protein